MLFRSNRRFRSKNGSLLFLFFGFRAGRGGPKQLAMMQLMPMPWKGKKDDSTFAQHRGSILASHPGAPDSVLGIPKNFYLDVA